MTLVVVVKPEFIHSLTELKLCFWDLGGKASTTTPTPTESDAEEVSPRRGRSGRVTRTSEMNGSIASDGKGDAKEVRNQPFFNSPTQNYGELLLLL